MNQKLLSILLCLCLLCGMTMAYAEDTGTEYKDITDLNQATEYEGYRNVTESGNVNTANVYTANVDVKVTLEETKEGNEYPEYYVEIVWGNMFFGYGALEEGRKLWNTETHEYEYLTRNNQTLERGWYLMNNEPLDDAYNNGENGVKWVHDQDLETSQAHVLIFNHSNRKVIVDAQINTEGVAATTDAKAIVKPVSNEDVCMDATEEEAEAHYSYVMPKGVESTDTVDNRWHKSTTAVLEVAMEGTLDAQYDEKTHIANLRVTLSKDEDETENTIPEEELPEGFSLEEGADEQEGNNNSDNENVGA